MSYTGDVGEISAVWRPVAEVETIDRPLVRNRLVATGDVTRGQYGLFDWRMEPRAGGPEPHFHRTFSESFYVISGSVRLYNGDTWVTGTPGDFLYVPQGGVHAFRNDSDEPASMLILFAPAPPREKFFRELAEIADSGRRLSAQEWAEFYARHDQYMV
ncbi:quercetin dioxygenase-like cupin family protein [Saccharothrix carnea]|uniref:Quercetin dioxygenase-like cupin family protein n=1 Tax=Saccharothrix carnea TaxID=1280637 RepID=A0A2P8IJA2_SACCR|nr:cupin domain-containing protein [Saccharothrix carnea]PSL58562.1 quercetin dioxygenase-like cupin family protein [Saccharothrix carnea]